MGSAVGGATDFGDGEPMNANSSSFVNETALPSYLAGKWESGRDRGAPLVNPSDATTLLWASSRGLDLGSALDFSRTAGGPALKKLSYAQRAEMLGKMADLLATKRDRWYEIARLNSGNTKADAAIDVDGSIARPGGHPPAVRCKGDGDEVVRHTFEPASLDAFVEVPKLDGHVRCHEPEGAGGPPASAARDGHGRHGTDVSAHFPRLGQCRSVPDSQPLVVAARHSLLISEPAV